MKKITALLLTGTLCLGLMAPVGAADGQQNSETHTETFDYSGEIWEIPNVTKVGYVAWIGGYYDDNGNVVTEEGNITTYDPTGWMGDILNDTVGYPVYYVSGDSVTVRRSGDLHEWSYSFTPEKITETGSFSFDAMMSAMDFSQFRAVGVGFAKCDYDESVASVPIPEGETEVTLGKGIWAGPGVQDFTSFFVIVGDENDYTGTGDNSTGDNSTSETSTGGEASANQTGFTDVPAASYCAEPVAWAVENGITTGTSTTTFSPDDTCTNAQILTFMWRAAGSPEPTGSNPFTNLRDTDYFYQAALWASENGLVSGTEFNAEQPCTRAMTMEYFWKQAGSPDAAPSDRFTDVSADASYASAVAWAVEKGVTTGTSDNTFSPDDTCTRGQIVTFLYRDLAQ